MKIIQNSPQGIREAAEILTGNGIVAFPTETVYGLGANAFSKEAVTKLYEIKRRPSFNPLIIHVSSYDMAKEYGIFNYTAEKLVKKVLAFPHHQHLTKNEIIKVANTINNFYKKKYENSL